MRGPARAVLPLVVVALAGCSVSEPSVPTPSPSSTTTTASFPDTTSAIVPAMSSPSVSPSSTSTTPPPTTSTTDTPPSSPPLLAPPAPGPSGDPHAPLPDEAEQVTVVSITDGDTLEVTRADGSLSEVRLIGINAPESGECLSVEAAMALGVLAPAGAEVGMTVDVSDVDQFDRLLRYLWLGGLSVNEELVRRGAAIARRFPPDTAMADRLEAAQTEARAAGLGVWAPDACGPRAEADLSVVEVRYDAPGDDSQNLNEEWVQIRNDGDSAIDLTGWRIRDESAGNRFEFPDSFTLAAGESAIVRSGCGTSFGIELFWCSTGAAIWNNDGDTVFLLDPSGNVHATYQYSGE